MGFRSFFSTVASWFGLSQSHTGETDENNMLKQDALGEEESQDDSEQQSGQLSAPWASRKKVKPQSIEKLQEGFDNLVEQLQGINKHLDKTVNQQDELMRRIEQLPDILETFPDYVENQKKMTEQFMEQLKANSAKDQQLIDAVEKLPAETSRQTDALADINRQLSTVADADANMTDNFNKFKDSLDKLNTATDSQNQNLKQMSETFQTSDKDLKYLISVQNRRFMWMFITALSVCVIVILLLVGALIYLKQ